MPRIKYRTCMHYIDTDVRCPQKAVKLNHSLTPDSHTAYKYNLMFWQGYAFVWHSLDKF